MEFIHAHLFFFGMAADSLTFVGGGFLAWDAFFRLRDLNDKRVDQQFAATFPKVILTDDDWKAAFWSVLRALIGAGLLVLGFLCQIVLRVAEAQ